MAVVRRQGRVCGVLALIEAKRNFNSRSAHERPNSESLLCLPRATGRAFPILKDGDMGGPGV